MRILFITATIAIVTLVGCVRPPVEHPPANAPVEPPQESASVKPPPASEPEKRPCCRSTKPAPSRAAIVRTAAKLVGATTIESKGRRIAYDCAGVTRAIFLEHGIDLYDGNESDPKANGVRLIYANVRQHGRFHQGPMVRPGDLVFFDNTWDFNGDGKLNDPLTHVGVVERVKADGTVVFISRVTATIARYRMNLGLPHVHKTAKGRVLNDYLRRKRSTDPDEMGRLTGELFAFYGTRLGP
jgi:hypothetical protein